MNATERQQGRVDEIAAALLRAGEALQTARLVAPGRHAIVEIGGLSAQDLLAVAELVQREIEPMIGIASASRVSGSFHGFWLIATGGKRP